MTRLVDGGKLDRSGVPTYKVGVRGLGFAAAAVALALSGCASAGAGAGGARATGGTACWPVVPLELQALEHGREWEPIARVAADGSISNARGPWGRIAGDAATFSAGGTVWLQARCVGRVVELTSPVSPALKTVVSYDAGDGFNERAGWQARITVADDGMVDMRTRGDRRVFGRPGSGGGVVRVVGDVRAGRRTAALLVYTTAALGAGR